MISLLPYNVWEAPWLAPCALALDLLLGDPPLPWPHPVVLIGRLMNKMEPWARSPALRRHPSSQRLWGRLAGLACLALLLFLTGLCACLLMAPPYIGAIAALYLAWAGLAMGCLLRTGGMVLRQVEQAPPVDARNALSQLVSRDVSKMDRKLLRKTLADTLSENFTDAFCAPFFWLLIGGPAALWLYKTVSTMDSQWGYMTPKWIHLGFFGAKADDLLAWLPARISIILLCMTDKILNLFPHLKSWTGRPPGFKIIASQASGMPSPNSGWSMTACAWLCGRRMAGSSVYFGELVKKPLLGPAKAPPWSRDSLLALCDLMFYSALFGGFALWLAFLLAAFPLRLIF